jgi:DNA polymerase-4/DNA polymerase V
MIHTYQSNKAILHIDGDSFFASCEVAKNPSLRGKPVITGKERGIASSMTYEAKARGVSRAMSLRDIMKICPDAIILPSDYETYSLYSLRMYEIVRRYTPAIEEYSIDECFADLTGMRRVNNMSYEKIAQNIKHDLDTELGITFSVGLAMNKVVAKIASKWKKPSGLTIINTDNLNQYLAKWPVGKIWGIGPNTNAFLNNNGIYSSLDFANRDIQWVKTNMSKPFHEIHAEMNGQYVYELNIGEKHDYASISKTKTFTPPSRDSSFVFSQLSKNIENAFIKLRRHQLYTKKFSIFLKTQDFHYSGLEFRLDNETCTPESVISISKNNFSDIFRDGMQYRATGIVLMDLGHDSSMTMDLFGQYDRYASMKKIYEAFDSLASRYGKHSLFLGSSFLAMNNVAHKGSCGQSSERQKNIIRGETKRKKINLPFLGECL